ncbi:hypothetical protein ABK040_013344 [Willaertia magna]
MKEEEEEDNSHNKQEEEVDVDNVYEIKLQQDNNGKEISLKNIELHENQVKSLSLCSLKTIEINHSFLSSVGIIQLKVDQEVKEKEQIDTTTQNGLLLSGNFPANSNDELEDEEKLLVEDQKNEKPKNKEEEECYAVEEEDSGGGILVCGNSTLCSDEDILMDCEVLNGMDECIGYDIVIRESKLLSKETIYIKTNNGNVILQNVDIQCKKLIIESTVKGNIIIKSNCNFKVDEKVVICCGGGSTFFSGNTIIKTNDIEIFNIPYTITVEENNESKVLPLTNNQALYSIIMKNNSSLKANNMISIVGSQFTCIGNSKLECVKQNIGMSGFIMTDDKSEWTVTDIINLNCHIFKGKGKIFGKKCKMNLNVYRFYNYGSIDIQSIGMKDVFNFINYGKLNIRDRINEWNSSSSEIYFYNYGRMTIKNFIVNILKENDFKVKISNIKDTVQDVEYNGSLNITGLMRFDVSSYVTITINNSGNWICKGYFKTEKKGQFYLVNEGKMEFQLGTESEFIAKQSFYMISQEGKIYSKELLCEGDLKIFSSVLTLGGNNNDISSLIVKGNASFTINGDFNVDLKEMKVEGNLKIIIVDNKFTYFNAHKTNFKIGKEIFVYAPNLSIHQSSLLQTSNSNALIKSNYSTIEGIFGFGGNTTIVVLEKAKINGEIETDLKLILNVKTLEGDLKINADSTNIVLDNIFADLFIKTTGNTKMTINKEANSDNIILNSDKNIEYSNRGKQKGKNLNLDSKNKLNVTFDSKVNTKNINLKSERVYNNFKQGISDETSLNIKGNTNVSHFEGDIKASVNIETEKKSYLKQEGGSVQSNVSVKGETVVMEVENTAKNSNLNIDGNNLQLFIEKQLGSLNAFARLIYMIVKMNLGKTIIKGDEITYKSKLNTNETSIIGKNNTNVSIDQFNGLLNQESKITNTNINSTSNSSKVNIESEIESNLTINYNKEGEGKINSKGDVNVIVGGNDDGKTFINAGNDLNYLISGNLNSEKVINAAHDANIKFNESNDEQNINVGNNLLLEANKIDGKLNVETGNMLEANVKDIIGISDFESKDICQRIDNIEGTHSVNSHNNLDSHINKIKGNYNSNTTNHAKEIINEIYGSIKTNSNTSNITVNSISESGILNNFTKDKTVLNIKDKRGTIISKTEKGVQQISITNHYSGNTDLKSGSSNDIEVNNLKEGNISTFSENSTNFKLNNDNSLNSKIDIKSEEDIILKIENNIRAHLNALSKKSTSLNALNIDSNVYIKSNVIDLKSNSIEKNAFIDIISDVATIRVSTNLGNINAHTHELIDFNVKNQLGKSSIHSDKFANLKIEKNTNNITVNTQKDLFIEIDLNDGLLDAVSNENINANIYTTSSSSSSNLQGGNIGLNSNNLQGTSNLNAKNNANINAHNISTNANTNIHSYNTTFQSQNHNGITNNNSLNSSLINIEKHGGTFNDNSKQTNLSLGLTTTNSNINVKSQTANTDVKTHQGYFDINTTSNLTSNFGNQQGNVNLTSQRTTNLHCVTTSTQSITTSNAKDNNLNIGNHSGYLKATSSNNTTFHANTTTGTSKVELQSNNNTSANLNQHKGHMSTKSNNNTNMYIQTNDGYAEDKANHTNLAMDKTTCNSKFNVNSNTSNIKTDLHEGEINNNTLNSSSLSINNHKGILNNTNGGNSSLNFGNVFESSKTQSYSNGNTDIRVDGYSNGTINSTSNGDTSFIVDSVGKNSTTTLQTRGKLKAVIKKDLSGNLYIINMNNGDIYVGSNLNGNLNAKANNSIALNVENRLNGTVDLNSLKNTIITKNVDSNAQLNLNGQENIIKSDEFNAKQLISNNTTLIDSKTFNNRGFIVGDKLFVKTENFTNSGTIKTELFSVESNTIDLLSTSSISSKDIALKAKDLYSNGILSASRVVTIEADDLRLGSNSYIKGSSGVDITVNDKFLDSKYSDIISDKTVSFNMKNQKDNIKSNVKSEDINIIFDDYNIEELSNLHANKLFIQINGDKIIDKDVSINGFEVLQLSLNNFINRGSVNSNNTLIINAKGDITNEGNMKAKTLALISDENINLEKGTIHGTENETVEGKTIKLVSDNYNRNLRRKYNQRHNMSYTAREGGLNFANSDIDISGDLILNANGDIDLGFGKQYYGRRPEFLTTSIKCNSFDISSMGNIDARGIDINSKKGGNLIADKKLDISSLTETYVSRSYSRSSGLFNLFSENVYEEDNVTKTTNITSSEGHANLQSTNDMINAKGLQIISGGKTKNSIIAKKDVILDPIEAVKHFRHSSTSFWGICGSSSSGSSTVGSASNIVASGDVEVRSIEGKLSMKGANFFVNDKLTLRAKKGIDMRPWELKSDFTSESWGFNFNFFSPPSLYNNIHETMNRFMNVTKSDSTTGLISDIACGGAAAFNTMLGFSKLNIDPTKYVKDQFLGCLSNVGIGFYHTKMDQKQTRQVGGSIKSKNLELIVDDDDAQAIIHANIKSENTLISAKNIKFGGLKHEQSTSLQNNSFNLGISFDPTQLANRTLNPTGINIGISSSTTDSYSLKNENLQQDMGNVTFEKETNVLLENANFTASNTFGKKANFTIDHQQDITKSSSSSFSLSTNFIKPSLQQGFALSSFTPSFNIHSHEEYKTNESSFSITGNQNNEINVQHNRKQDSKSTVGFGLSVNVPIGKNNNNSSGELSIPIKLSAQFGDMKMRVEMPEIYNTDKILNGLTTIKNSLKFNPKLDLPSNKYQFESEELKENADNEYKALISSGIVDKEAVDLVFKSKYSCTPIDNYVNEENEFSKMEQYNSQNIEQYLSDNESNQYQTESDESELLGDEIINYEENNNESNQHQIESNENNNQYQTESDENELLEVMQKQYLSDNENELLEDKIINYEENNNESNQHQIESNENKLLEDMQKQKTKIIENNVSLAIIQGFETIKKETKPQQLYNPKMLNTNHKYVMKYDLTQKVLTNNNYKPRILPKKEKKKAFKTLSF